MIRFVLLAIVVAIAAGSTLSVAQAKGPPVKVVISGGNLTSDVVIEEPDLTSIGPGFFEASGPVRPTAYAPGDEIVGETQYLVTIFELDSGNQLWQFLSENYFPANTQHASLLAQDGKLWKVVPTFAALLDGRIRSALSPANLPSSGGPPAGGNANGWAYALLAAGVLLLLGSVATAAYSRRK